MKNQSTKPTTQTSNTELLTVDAIELDNVTGGCAACGCNMPAAAMGATTTQNPNAFASFASRFRR